MKVNDAVIVGGETLVSCSSDATLKVSKDNQLLQFLYQVSDSEFFYDFVLSAEIHQTWNCFGDGICTKTLTQHSDYVTCLAAAENNVKSITTLLSK